MFPFKKRVAVKTILITRSDVLTDSLKVNAVWQQRHVPQNLPFVLSRAILLSSNDPLEFSLTQYLQSQADSVPSAQPLYSFSFDHHAGVSGNIWHKGADYQIDIKGMPERVLELCDMSENERESIMLQVQAMSSKGLYVIALASGASRRSVKQMSDLAAKEKLSFAGLIGLRLEVSPAARQCMQMTKTKNIAVYLTTGLHPTVAYYLSKEVELANRPNDVFDMRRAEITHREQMHTIVDQHAVFARASSQHKNRLLNELKNIDPNTNTVDSIETYQKLLAATP